MIEADIFFWAFYFCFASLCAGLFTFTRWLERNLYAKIHCVVIRMERRLARAENRDPLNFNEIMEREK